MRHPNIFSGLCSGLFRAMIPAILMTITALPASAVDLGVHGKVWPVTEANLLDRIAAELGRAEADGRLAAFNDSVKQQAVSAFTSRPPLPLAHVTKPSHRLFDPTITVRRDIRDHQGRIIVAAGTSVNPLDTLPRIPALVFLDGRDPDQLAFALDHPEPSRLILTGGNPLALMKAHDRQFFYDQKGVLTAKFGLRAVPSVITRQGRQLLISEIAVGDNHAGKEARP